ncbi:DUF4132 domain-containing protein [Nocardia sp. NPDC056100]|uniref:DUF4132 domain-containing protein n=1 Tax=Nocardia sp. NPDC056100 TaxID=3345712 RepID=UPI0035D81D3E
MTFTLDYGPRRFTVTVDERLRPTIDGIRRRLPPTATPTDDPRLAAAARRAYREFREDLKSIASEQLQRLERAMTTGTRWTVEYHRHTFMTHPVLWQLTRRLLWASFDVDGAITTPFRIEDDRVFRDRHGDTVTLADSACIGIAHPAQLGPELAEWRTRFAANAIAQPFDQLGAPALP